MTAALDSVALLAALVAYRGRIVPQVRREQRRWRDLVEAIQDPGLRDAALVALGEKGNNAEATAVFAILAPPRRRPAAVRAIVALQTAIDYLDTLGEQQVDDALTDGLVLHEALPQALSPGTVVSDWYRLRPNDDNGYLAALVAACRKEVAALPAKDAVLWLAQRAARRCGEGQSHTHAAAGRDSEGLRRWAEQQTGLSDYLWWEVAAGASSSVAVHALIAAAADPRTSVEEAERIDATYFPPIGALTVFLDDLVDLEHDRSTGEHSYLTYYANPSSAAERLAFIADRARSATADLRRSHRHAAILAGVAGFYLASPPARGDYASRIHRRMLDSLGVTARLALAVTRIRRRD